MEYTLEAYLSQYDELNIFDDVAYEGFSESIKRFGKAVIIAIKTMIRKMIAWFQNLLLNINYFKNAVVDEKMSKDLLYMLRLMEPRTLVGSSLLPRLWKVFQTFHMNPDKTNFMDGSIGRAPFVFSMPTDLDHEMKKTFEDLENSKNAVESSAEYQRYQEDKYTNEKTVEVPMTHLIPDMKYSRKSLVDCEGQLASMENKADALGEDRGLQESFSKMTHLLRSLISYYRFRIVLLSKFFNAAKASLQATAKNFTERKNEEYMSRSKSKGDLARNTSVIVPDGAHFKEVLKGIKEANKNKDWRNYLELRTELFRMLKTNKSNVICILSVNYNGPFASVNFNIIHSRAAKVPVEGKKLYHHSTQDGLTELLPNAIGDGAVGIFYPTPRVYCHISYPLDKGSKKIGTQTFGLELGEVYEVTDNIKEVYNDPEMGRTACYIETTKPIKVKKIKYSDFKKDMDVKINADSVEFNKK